MFSKSILFSLLTAAALVASGSAQAAEKAKPDAPKPAAADEKGKETKKRDTYPFGGKIAKVDAAAHSFTIAYKESSRTFLTTPETKFTKAGKPATFADLKDGEEVGGLVKKNKDGKEEVVSMRVGPKPAEPGKAGDAKPEPKKKTDDKK
jgi:hypothetical protein